MSTTKWIFLLSFFLTLDVVGGFLTLPLSIKVSLSASAVKDSSDVESYLATHHPTFATLISPKYESVWKKLREADQYTIFAPTASAFEALGPQKLRQLQDPRNSETTEKICTFHCINEPVSAEELFSCGGVITLGGTVPVTRSISGGVFGLGGKEDGTVKVQGAKVVRSVEVSNCIIHEVDSLVSPQLLWRFMDQLRIPFSK